MANKALQIHPSLLSRDQVKYELQIRDSFVSSDNQSRRLSKLLKAFSDEQLRASFSQLTI